MKTHGKERMNDELSTTDDWLRVAFETHAPGLTRYAYSLCRDAELARDAVQETFFRLCREDYRELRDKLVPWLFRVCRSRVLDSHRKEGRMSALDEATTARTASREASPAASAETSEATGIVLGMLDHLPPRQREVVRLKFQNGLSYKEIAEIMEISVSNVGFHLNAALKSLRQRLRADTDLLGTNPAS